MKFEIMINLHIYPVVSVSAMTWLVRYIYY